MRGVGKGSLSRDVAVVLLTVAPRAKTEAKSRDQRMHEAGARRGRGARLPGCALFTAPRYR